MIEQARPESLSPQQNDTRPPLFVERRSTHREHIVKTPPVQARRRLPGWVGPAAGLVLTAAALIVSGPVAALACALIAGALLTRALVRLNRRADGFDRLAHTDYLTGLANSRALWRDLDGELSERSLALVMIDLDHFKMVNDLHGHAIGDAVLKTFGKLLPQVIGTDGRCYRYGGEEFVVVVPDAGEAPAAVVAERVRARVAKGLGGALPQLTLSAGIAAAATGCGGHRLLDRADGALRHAKGTGRDRVVLASAIDEQQADHASLAARRAALAIATAALEARDPDTADHSDDVVVLCEAIADRLGIRGAAREHLLVGASLHDVGKVAVPHEILAKPGPLDEDEWEVMRRHTITGEQILRSVPELEPVAPIVRSAHERYDGTGYPDGLAGEDIPLSSRVIFCADAFHAIRSDRPYRAGSSPEVAAHELEVNAGTQFDPVVAAALVDVVREANAPGPPGTRQLFGRSPRLMALLGTVAVAGTAAASVPSVRDEVRKALKGGNEQIAPASPRAPGSAATCAELALQGVACSVDGAIRSLTVTAPARERASSVQERLLPVAEPARAGTDDPAVDENAPVDQTAVPAIDEAAAPGAPQPAVEATSESTSGRSEAAPGQTGATPGQSGTAPGRSGSTPGQGGTAPGQSGTAPGQSGSTPGNSGNAPGQQTGSAPGNSGNAPGQSGTAPGNSGSAPGQQTGTAPGNSGSAPGQSGEAPGKSGEAPGNSSIAPGPQAQGSSGNGGGKGNGPRSATGEAPAVEVAP